MKPGTLGKILAGAGAYALGLYLFNFFPPLPSNFRPATALVPGVGLFWGGDGATAAGRGHFLFVPFFLPPRPSKVRPAAVLVPGLGLFWGGAGSIAAALGNFLFGLRDEIDLGTPLGILGNLVFAYLPFRVA